jgi:exopolysaccharide biosynthesis WecB/TagA/CpsF family protein
MVRVGGVRVGALSRSEWAAYAIAAAHAHRKTGGRPRLTTSANGNVQSLYARSSRFRAMLDAFDAVEADGMPMVWASRLLTRTPIPERSAMTDLFHDVAARAAEEGLSLYFLGGNEEVNAAAVSNAQRLYPGLIVAGRRNGYFTAAEEAGVVDAINAAKPDILLVGFGVPKEHEFTMRNVDRLHNVGVVKTCGGLFDFLSGKNPRAPQWMQDASLEWLYRLMNEPGRLFWRYATTNVHALWLMTMRTADVPL